MSGILVRIRTALFRVGFFTICLSKDETSVKISKQKYTCIWVLIKSKVKGCVQVVNKSVVVAGWRFVDNTGNQTGKTTITLTGSDINVLYMKIPIMVWKGVK